VGYFPEELVKSLSFPKGQLQKINLFNYAQLFRDRDLKEFDPEFAENLIWVKSLQIFFFCNLFSKITKFSTT